jgi:hypothetical protein
VSLVLFGVALVALGVVVGSWRVLWLPASLGGAYAVGAVIFESLRHQDNPSLFLIVVAGVAMAIGVWTRKLAALRSS